MRTYLKPSLLIILPLILSGCSFAFMPSGGGGGAAGPMGVFKSTDKGLSWQEKNNLAHNEKNLAPYQTRQLEFNIFDKNIIYRGTNVGLFKSEDAGDSWYMINNKDIHSFTLNPKSRGIIYIVSGNQLFRTTDDGQSWNLIYTESRHNIHIADVAISHFDTSYIYILTNDGTLLLSQDWGESWRKLQDFESRAKALFINPHNSQHIYVTTQRELYRSLDEGDNWQNIIQDKNKQYPGIDIVGELHFNNQENDIIYLSKYGILKSSDSGQNWQKVQLISDPNSVDIHVLTFDKSNPREIFYIVGNVIYHTIDNGINWKTKALPVPGGAKATDLLLNQQNIDEIYLAVGR